MVVLEEDSSVSLLCRIRSDQQMRAAGDSTLQILSETFFTEWLLAASHDISIYLDVGICV